jgi:hypothetical protein
MPIVSDSQLARIQSVVAGANNKMAKMKARAEEKAGELKDGLEIVGAASLMGLIRGYAEAKGGTDGQGQFVIPGTAIDIELISGLTLVGLGMSDLLGKYDNDSLMLGYGILAHYAGQVARNSTRESVAAGKMQFKSIAGENDALNGMLQGVI